MYHKALKVLLNKILLQSLYGYNTKKQSNIIVLSSDEDENENMNSQAENIFTQNFVSRMIYITMITTKGYKTMFYIHLYLMHIKYINPDCHATYINMGIFLA